MRAAGAHADGTMAEEDGVTAMQRAELRLASAAARLRELDVLESVALLRGAAVVGMTTTGAAKMGAALAALRPRVAVVEEAARKEKSKQR